MTERRGPTRLRIEGGHPIGGVVTVEGNKNAALPLLAACLLTEEPCHLRNMPRIRDVAAMASALESLGAEVEGVGTTAITVRAARLTGDRPDPGPVGALRGSVLLTAPVLARRGRVELPATGGDFPGRRSVSVHVAALRALGARELPGPGTALEIPDGFRPASLYLLEASVTGTETALLAAAAAPGVSEIRHAACEPHVVDLCRFLEGMGVGIKGAGTPTLRVTGARRRTGARWRLGGDFVEAGSWAVIAAITGGALEIRGAAPRDLEPIVAVLSRLGVRSALRGGALLIEPSALHAAPRITTAPWPGFPSDLVSLVTVLAAAAEGATLIHDWMYELRLFALEQLRGMGAELFLCDPHRILVNGPAPLRAGDLDARDIRSGMALIAAALAAEGVSSVAPLEVVERGYADLANRLRRLGAVVAVESGS